MRKLLLTLGTMTAIALPVASVIACGNHSVIEKTELQKVKEKTHEAIKPLKLNASEKTKAEHLVDQAGSETEVNKLIDNLKDPVKKEKLLGNGSFEDKKVAAYKEEAKPDAKLDANTLSELNNILDLDIKVVTYKNLIQSVKGVLEGTIELDFIARKSGSISNIKIDSGQEVNIVLTPPKVTEDNSIEVKILVNGEHVEVNKEKGIPTIVKLLDTFTENLKTGGEITL